TSPILHEGRGVFAGLPSPFEATRYHSLIVERASLPSCLVVTAWTAEGEIMGLEHQERRIEGVQFHPESILTGHGKALLGNWVGRLRAPACPSARAFPRFSRASREATCPPPSCGRRSRRSSTARGRRCRSGPSQPPSASAERPPRPSARRPRPCEG